MAVLKKCTVVAFTIFGDFLVF